MYLRLLKCPHSVNAKRTAVKRTDISIIHQILYRIMEF
jgi:hypothetical protein